MITAQIDRISLGDFRKYVERYKARIGKTEEDIIRELSKAAAKELAIKIQPFGITSQVGKKFEKSIGKQVWRAVKNAQVTGGVPNIEAAHRTRRTSNGQVRMHLKTKGQMRQSPFYAQDVTAYAITQAKKAGAMKGAWIAAGEAAGGGKISGVAKWVRRHANNNGSATVSLSRSGTSAYLHNSIGYISRAQVQNYVNTALRIAYRKQEKRMRISIRRASEKSTYEALKR